MILFLDDWIGSGAVLDTQGQNKTFLRMASLYKEMGIKNHAFMLALYDRDLLGVDPFDPYIDIVTMGKIAAECKRNPFYYLRSIAKAPGNSGSDAVYIEGNRGNIALYWCFFNHIMQFLIQPRQTGKSLSTDTLSAYLMEIACVNTNINLLTKDDGLRRKNIERVKEIMNEYPRYLDLRTRDDANNGEEITVKRLNNTYTTHVPQPSPKRANNLGRGLTSPIFHIDEAPFQVNIDLALGASLAAGGAAIENARRTGAPYGTILTTTAGKKDDKSGAYIYRLLTDAAYWTERFFDAKNHEELEDMVRNASRGKKFRVNITLSHKQLGKDDEWLKRKLEESLQEGDDAARDYLNLWLAGGAHHPLKTEVLEMLRANQKQPLYTEVTDPHNYIIRWYIPEDEIDFRMSRNPIMNFDTSDASGGDDISLIILDPETLEVIGAGTFNDTNLFVFANWVCSLFVRFKEAVGVIERRSTGGMLLDYLLIMLPQHGIDPFKCLFNRVVNESDEFPERYREINTPMGKRPSDIYVRYKKLFGYPTSGSGEYSRSNLYSGIVKAAKQGGDGCNDIPLVDQIAGLVIRNGRVDHEVGEHDDLVVGWLLGYWFLSKGRNLSFYGIDVRKVLSLTNSGTVETYEEIEMRIEQQQIREEIEAIYNELSEAEDDYISAKLERQLAVLDKRLILEDGDIFSLDGLIKSAREARINRRRTNPNNRHSYDYTPPQTNSYHGVLTSTPMGYGDFRRRY